MNKSDLIYGIANQPALARRVEALVREFWWNDPAVEEPHDWIDIPALMWGVATNPSVRATVEAAMDAANEEDELAQGDISKAVAAVPDSDLEYILFNPTSGAVGRITPKPQPEPVEGPSDE